MILVMLRCCLVALPLSALAAQTPKGGDANFPSRPVRMIVAQAAGGPTDVAARVYAARLSEIMGQQAVVACHIIVAVPLTKMLEWNDFSRSEPWRMAAQFTTRLTR